MKRYERLYLVILVALLAASASVWRWTQAADRLVYDTVHLAFTAKAPDNIAIIAIDEKSLLELGRWPWPRQTHAQLINLLSAAGVEVVGFDVIFAEKDTQSPESDQQLIAAVERHGGVALPMVMESLQYQGQILEVLPFPPLAELAAGIGHVHVEYDSDGVCRSVFLHEGLGAAYWPHLAQTLHWLAEKKSIRYGHHEPRPITIASAIVRDTQRNIPIIGPENSFLHISYADVIAGRLPASLLRGKIVLVGATAKGLGDQIITPRGQLSGVELNANILHAIANERFIHVISPQLHALISFLVTLFAALYASRLTPRQFLVFTFACALATVITATALLAFGLLWFAPLSVVVSTLLFYPLWSWRRLERALGFLKERLSYVRQQKSIIAENQGIHALELALDFLKQLAIISDGCVIGSNKTSTIEANGKLDFQWQNQDYQVLYSYTQAPGLNIERWLKAIVDEIKTYSQQRSTTPIELVGKTIQQLDFANRQVEYGRQLFEQGLEKLQDGVIVVSHTGGVQFFNEQARLFIPKLVVGEACLTHLQQLELPPGVNWPQCLQQLLNEKQPFFYEVTTKDEHFDLICQGRLLKIHGDAYDTLIIVLTDISLLKETERARAEAVNFLSHDLRSPMVSVLALLDKAKRQKDYQASDSFIRDIEGYVQKNLAYAESFLRLAKAEAVKNEVFDFCDLHAVVDNAVSHVLPQAQQKTIAIRIQRPDDDLWIWGDWELLERALINLLTNGIKYSAANTHIVVRLVLDATYGAVDNPGLVHIHIIDQGRGIAEEEQKTMFERFTRSRSTRQEQGVGLGLHFVQMVCRRHGGAIKLESELGKGSTFIVTLPRVVPDEDAL